MRGPAARARTLQILCWGAARDRLLAQKTTSISVHELPHHLHFMHMDGIPMDRFMPSGWSLDRWHVS